MFLDIQFKSARTEVELTSTQGSKLLGVRMSGTPKNGGGNPILGPGFPTRNPKIVRLTDSLKLEFSDRKPTICRGNPNTEAGFPNGNPIFYCNF